MPVFISYLRLRGCMVEKLGLFNKTKLIGILGAFLLAGFMATSIASYFISKANIRESVLMHELPLASDNIHSEIQRILLPPLNVSETMANSVFLRDWILSGEQDVEKISDYLDKIQSKQGMTSAFLISDKTRNYYSHEGLRGPIDPEGVDRWYASCRDNRANFEINADLDMHVSNRVTLFINYKVYDYEGRFIGITGVAERIESIEALIHRFREQYEKTIYFASPGGQVVFHAEENADPLNKPNLAQYMGSSALASRLLSQPSSTMECERDGHDVILTARFLPELGWYLVVEEEVNCSTRHLRRILGMNLTICFLLTVLVLAVVYLTVQQYQRRIQRQHQDVLHLAGELEGQNSELERLHREKDEFMKMVVHDLKTPLSGIIGMARLIQTETDPALIKEFSERTEETGEELSALIQNLLDLKSIESAVLPDFEEVDIGQVLESVWPSWNANAQSKSIRMVKDAEKGPYWVQTSAVWLRSIMGNLVSNAIKFSREGTEVRVAVESTDLSVCVSVVDQGPGILPEEQDLLFRQFSRLSSRPTGGESTNGLGLFIVKTMVEKMGGTVGCKSEPGAGSRFWVEFPAKGQ